METRKLDLRYDKITNTLEIHQEGVDIDGMPIGKILNITSYADERVIATNMSKTVQQIKFFNRNGEIVAYFWAMDINSFEVIG